jgi:hypothetical protein
MRVSADSKVLTHICLKHPELVWPESRYTEKPVAFTFSTLQTFRKLPEKG